MRLTSKQFNDLASSILFSSVKIEIASLPTKEKCDDIVAALSSGTAAVFRHVTRMRVYMDETYVTREEEKPWFDLLDLLFPVITNLYSLE